MSLRGLALSRSTVDRATVLREDPSWIEAAWAAPTTRVLVISEGRALLGPDGFLSFVTTEQAPAGTRFFLGLDPQPPASPVVPEAPAVPDTPVAPEAPAVPDTPIIPKAAADPSAPDASADPSAPATPVGSSAPAAPAAPLPGQIAYFGISGPLPDIAGTETVTLRQSGALLSDRDAGLLTHAVALANWHDSHTHCPRCGAPTMPAPAGHLATCSIDGTQHFPRTDPAVIMLVTDSADRCLLARNAAWGERRMSVLAGFVEPGESAEMAVAREVFEETAVTVTDVRYLGSQPWPMPRSLMLGYRASAPGEQSIVVDAEEIAEARWFARAELLAALKAGELALPPQSSIARRIIESWYGAELPSGSVPFR